LAVGICQRRARPLRRLQLVYKGNSAQVCDRRRICISSYLLDATNPNP
jgi:hypothetical protein